MNVSMNAAVPCKCCGTPSQSIGTVDFNKSCMDRTGQRPFPPSNIAVPYQACPNCGFIFTTAMDRWSDEEFKSKIYNDDYIKADPPIPGRVNVPAKETPAYHKGKYIASFFAGAQKEIQLLDFGSGGNPGPTGLALIEEGFALHSYDPYRADTVPIDDRRFDLIIAVEVFEHVADLQKLAGFMKAHLSRDGLIWIQTLLHPHPTPSNILDSWYIAPRNGHVSIFTLPALAMLFRPFGINIIQNARRESDFWIQKSAAIFQQTFFSLIWHSVKHNRSGHYCR